mmetsp:Transcript_22775/g.49924  ORF Transcript_22775/g.49924 Transcript_22775/m.49924 type:complete len:206 (+) Transcript_22775:140-757(+)
MYVAVVVALAAVIRKDAQPLMADDLRQLHTPAGWALRPIDSFASHSDAVRSPTVLFVAICLVLIVAIVCCAVVASGQAPADDSVVGKEELQVERIPAPRQQRVEYIRVADGNSGVRPHTGPVFIRSQTQPLPLMQGSVMYRQQPTVPAAPPMMTFVPPGQQTVPSLRMMQAGEYAAPLMPGAPPLQSPPGSGSPAMRQSPTSNQA